jgi:type II secretory ATPase GspE/PulE/Tfp pilus assembly ATPase PilB-like protein
VIRQLAEKDTGSMPRLDDAVIRQLSEKEAEYIAQGPKVASADEIAAAVKAITSPAEKKASKKMALETAMAPAEVTTTETAPVFEEPMSQTTDMPALTNFAPEPASSNRALLESERDQKATDTGSFPTLTQQDAERHLSKQFEATRTQDLSELELARRAQEEAIVLLANQILGGAIKRHCSNIHITPGERQAIVHYRQNGQLYVDRRLPNTILTPLIARYKMMARMSLSETQIPQDGHIKVKSASKEIVCLVSTVPTEKGEHVLIWIV